MKRPAASTDPAPAAGVFCHTLRVPYADVDRMGYVYYANYLVYFEMARSELLRAAGVPYSELEDRGVALPVVEAHCAYRRPAHYEDLLAVRVRCRSIRNVRLRIDYEVLRVTDEAAPEGGERLAEGHTVHVCLSTEGKVLRLDPALRALVGQ